VRKWWRFLLLVLQISFSFSGCYRPSVNPSILEHLSDTGPVCWLGICPGTTTRSEAIAFLRNQPAITITSQNSEDPTYPSVGWSASPSGQERGILSGFFYNDKGDEVITIVALDVHNRLSLNEVVTKFGTPSQVLASENSTERLRLWLNLRYPDIGLLVTHVDSRTQSQHLAPVVLRPNMRIVSLRLFAPSRAESLDPGLIAVPGEYPYVPWPGWGAQIEIVDAGQ
jgi:hypothetical protein